LISTSLSLANRGTAQTTSSGALTGVITDQTNAVVRDAEIEIKDSARGTTRSTKSDRDGLYQFFFVAPSRYALIVTHNGFREERRTIEVLVGPPVTVNVSLHIATASTEIKVTDEAPLIKGENGDVSSTVNQKQISEVPNQGNDLTNVVQIAPGVLMNTTGGVGAPFSILGMPGTSYLYTVDGVNNTENGFSNQLVGSLGVMMGQNEVQEASVVSTGYSGQFGGAAGGDINYVTKSGTGEFHGNAQYYWNGTVMNANDWFLNAGGVARPPGIANQWAGSLGGPIKKEKLFFFFDTEGLRALVPQIFNVQIPSPEFEVATLKHIASDPRFGLSSATHSFYEKIFSLYNNATNVRSAVPFTSNEGFGCTGFEEPTSGLGITVPCALHYFEARGRPSQQSLIAGRLDWNVSRSDRAFLRVQYEGGHSALGIDPINPIFDFDSNIPWLQGQIVETHSFGSSSASQFLLAYSSFFNSNKMLNPAGALAAFPTVLCFCGQGTYSNLGRGDYYNPLGTVYGIPLRYQVSEDVMKTSRSHKFGFGANFEAIHWDMWQYSANAIGVLMPQTLDAFYQGGVDPAVLAGNDSIDWTQLFQSFPSKLNQRMAFHSFGVYGQDEWHARKDLSLTFALRAEHQANPTCEHSCFIRMAGPFDSVSHDPNQPYSQALFSQEHAFLKMDRVLWSPRVSFAWQPLGTSHSMVLRGGIGVFYDPVPGGPTLSFSSNPTNVNSFAVVNDNLAPGETTNLLADAAASNAAFVKGFNAGQTLAQIEASVAGFSPPAITLPGRIMHAPQYQKWSLELQQTFGVHSSMNLGYFGYHGIHGLVQEPDANAWGFGTLPATVPDARFSGVTTISSPGISNYNGLVTSFQHRFSRWTSGLFQINYTWGHALDEISNGGLFNFGHYSPPALQDPRNLRRNYGPAEYDVRHSLKANYVWELPLKALTGGRGPNSLLRGWQVSGTVFARSGFPYFVFDGLEMAIVQQRNYYGSLYAVPIGPLSANLHCGKGAAFISPTQPCQPPQILPNGTPNPQERFLQAGCETGFDVGNLGEFPACIGATVASIQGKNSFRGPEYFNTDFTIMKNTKIHGWEDASLGIGFQFFNLFNHPNFDTPDNNIADQYFGQIQGMSAPNTSLIPGGINDRRLIQVKAQLQF
jgi:hypothetical protein